MTKLFINKEFSLKGLYRLSNFDCLNLLIGHLQQQQKVHLLKKASLFLNLKILNSMHKSL